MGDMAMIALDMCEAHECLADDYVNGYMSNKDAYENGFINETGAEDAAVNAAWDRTAIGSLVDINKGLDNAIRDFDLAANCRVVNENTLNDEAVSNLSKLNPTCNICRDEMRSKDGKFGKFYYCGNKCKKQGAVSDKYWQSVRV